MALTVESLLLEFGKALAPLEPRLRGGEVSLLFAEIGLPAPGTVLGAQRVIASISAAADALAALPDVLSALADAITSADAGAIARAGSRTIPVVQAIMKAIDAVAAEVDAAAAAAGSGRDEVKAFAAEFAERLIGFALASYLERNKPVVGHLFILFGIIEISYHAASPAAPAYVRRVFRFDRFADLINDPVGILSQVYGWGGAEFDWDELLLRLSIFLNRVINFAFVQPGPPPFVRIAVIDVVTTDDPVPGVQAVLRVAAKEGLDAILPIGDTVALTVRSQAALEAGAAIALLPPAALRVVPPGAEVSGTVRFGVQAPHAAGAAPIVFLGLAGGSRVQADKVRIAVGADLIWDPLHGRADGAFVIEASMDGGKVVLNLAEADSFLAEILPGGPIELDADLLVRWSSATGFHFDGEAGLRTTRGLHRKLGSLRLDSLDLALNVSSDALTGTVALTGAAALGPITATVEALGTALALGFTRGNLGPVDLSVSFKPPDGVGLSIDGEGLSGGGFLRYSDADQSYAGVLELVYEDRISLKAIGLITTRLPGGESGYSLLILITAEFAPIQLGLGFTLNGVGGLLGYNRSAAVERLRSGLRDGTLSSILFPQDVIANAPRILSDLRQVFPPTAGHFIFGPMARLAWGTPPLLTIDLGLILELPNPLRMIILGVLRMALPTDDEVLLLLQVNFLGVIDFNAGTLAFDAHLFDSRLLGLTLDGDMAVRARWFGEKNLLLSVGGFHPLYQPPPLDLPKLSRITVNLLSGDDPRITLETYYAITSNTYQFGAKIELYASAGPFAVHGLLAYDVLFQRSPFHFSADAKAKLDLLAGSSVIAGIDLSLTLEGPTPYHAHGTAHLEICWFLEISVHFDHTWGEDRDTTLPSVAVLPRLHDALADPTNWQTALPPGKNLLVTYRKIAPPPGLLLIAPAGILTISQKVVPLDVPIQIFNDQSPADATLFSIEQVTSGPATLNKTATPEDFAPAQFFERSDTDKLTGKSFEQYDGGVRIDDTGELQAEYAAARDVTYQVFYKDPQRPQPVQTPGKERLQLEAAVFETFAVGGAVARSPLSHARRAQPAGLPGAVAVAQEQFTVVSSMDLSPLQDGQVFPSEAEALVHLHQLLRQQPSLEGEVQVIPAYEMSPA